MPKSFKEPLDIAGVYLCPDGDDVTIDLNPGVYKLKYHEINIIRNWLSDWLSNYRRINQDKLTKQFLDANTNSKTQR